jgi:XTP/dITP diphosphohydrolase/tetrapyrrole methylase family protein/MazG family protein
MSAPDSRPASPAETPNGEKIYDADFAESPERLNAYADFAAIVKQLRRDCPWDREQTHASVKHLLIEEAYEVVEAIDERDWDELKRELGDVFLHVLFHSRIAEEAGRFTIQDVIEAETGKLVRRHPHVFGEEASGTSAANGSQSSEGGAEGGSEGEIDTETVLANWEQIKQQERAEQGTPASVLEGVPAHLPSLLRALRVQEKAAGVGFDFPDQAQTWAKVEEEIREFQAAVAAAAAEADDETDDEAMAAAEDELGDVLFALVNYARRADLNPENALRATTRRFTRRFQHIEARLAETGQTVADVDLATADALWDEAKRAETTTETTRTEDDA